MLLQAAVHGAAAQSKGFGRLADVSLVTGKRALDQILLHFVEAHLLELGCGAGGLSAQAEIRHSYGWSWGGKPSSVHSVVQFAHIAGPRMFMESFERRGIKPGNVFAVALRIAVEEVVRKEVNIIAAVPQWRKMNLDGIQAEEKVLPNAAGCGFCLDVRVSRR